MEHRLPAGASVSRGATASIKSNRVTSGRAASAGNGGTAPLRLSGVLYTPCPFPVDEGRGYGVSAAITVERPAAQQAHDVLPGLVYLLQDGVASGASIGYLPPLDEVEATAYRASVMEDVARGTSVLLVARRGDVVVGTVQLALATKPNARHRAEVQKLIVVQSARGQGIGRLLMEAVEREARVERRTLLVLDTRHGDNAERLYRRLGYLEAGIIPIYTRGADGALEATVLFYRVLD